MSDDRRAVVVVHSQGALRTRVATALAEAGFEVSAAASWRESDPGLQVVAPRCLAVLVEVAQLPDSGLERIARVLSGAVVIRLVDCFGADAEDQVVLAHPALPGGLTRCPIRSLPQELTRLLSASPRPPATS